MLILIDNYDSFTYNLYQYLCELGAQVQVVRNDAATVREIAALKPQQIVISPGPGSPDRAGISVEVIRSLSTTIPTLGVCLGHQCLGFAFGGTVTGAGEIKHGKTSPVHHGGVGVFHGLPTPFEAVRYHSLAVLREGLPPSLEITAWTAEGLIMGLRHRQYPIEGVQFHPESIMTRVGKDLLRNFLEMRRE